jgi:hypothetical protein
VNLNEPGAAVPLCCSARRGSVRLPGFFDCGEELRYANELFVAGGGTTSELFVSHLGIVHQSKESAESRSESIGDSLDVFDSDVARRAFESEIVGRETPARSASWSCERRVLARPTMTSTHEASGA